VIGTARVVFVLATLGVALTVPVEAGPRKAALKLLHQIEQVDGAGSGLDADTLQGKTPAQLTASQPPPNPNATALNGLSAQQIINQAVSTATRTDRYWYLRVPELFVPPDERGDHFPRLLQLRQHRVRRGDFQANCNGAVTNDGTGYLTSIDNTAANGTIQCFACGCTTGGLTTGLAVSTTCLKP
jgi:hypothetical protein